MITATGVKKNEYDRGLNEPYEVELETIGDLYHFINYNYATLVTLSVSGSLQVGEF